MKIAVVGVGGVGGYFGGRLAQAGHEVHMVARGAHLAAIRAHGLRVESTLGDFVVSPAQATDSPSAVGPVDVVLVGVKAWQLSAAALTMGPLIGPETAVVPLLNGVEAPALLAAALGPGHALGGLCRIMASIVGPGHIRHVGMEPSIAFGELDDSRSPRAERLREAFTAAGVRASIPAAIRVAMWEKFMLIATWSGIGAVTRAPVGVWRALPGSRAMAERALAEVVDVARSSGVNLPESQIGTLLAVFDSLPAAGTASMQRDIMEGRPSELEAQNGTVVRMGAEAGLATPVHFFIYHSLLPQERAARGEQ